MNTSPLEKKTEKDSKGGAEKKDDFIFKDGDVSILPSENDDDL